MYVNCSSVVTKEHTEEIVSEVTTIHSMEVYGSSGRRSYYWAFCSWILL